MKAILLIFLYLLTAAETTRKFISPDANILQPVKSPANTVFHKTIYLTKQLLTKHFLNDSKVRLPRDYVEEEKEDDDDDENTPNVEQSPETERTSVSQTEDGVALLEKTMQKLQEKVKFTSTKEEEEERSQEEQALESRLGPHYLTTLGQSHSEELPLHVSHKADLPERNVAQETKQDCKINVVLVLSCVGIDCLFILLIICWILYIKYRVKRWVLSTVYTAKFS